MSRSASIAGFAAAVTLTVLTAPASAQSNVVDIPLAGSGSERVLFAGPANPPAILVMLAGGDGIVEISNFGAITRLGGNFLLRTQPLWLGQGFAVAILGPPNGASLLGQRHTAAYADAIGHVVDFARTRANAPVWLLGTSQGSTAAANGAAHLGGKVAGVVLTSSVTRENNSGETVFDSNLGAITIPALIIANQGDTCRSTPPADAARIAQALSRSSRKELLYVQSDEIRSPPCEAMAPHGYLGIEPVVVQRISDWIRSTSAR
ncbi:MAG: alpha/beta hydrolase [Alphaproteobacteria bacterium]|nr:alpha/beta hydrolase [Alphaproteobacteria bacterium]